VSDAPLALHFVITRFIRVIQLGHPDRSREGSRPGDDKICFGK